MLVTGAGDDEQVPPPARGGGGGMVKRPAAPVAPRPPSFAQGAGATLGRIEKSQAPQQYNAGGGTLPPPLLAALVAKMQQQQQAGAAARPPVAPGAGTAMPSPVPGMAPALAPAAPMAAGASPGIGAFPSRRTSGLSPGASGLLTDLYNGGAPVLR